MESRRPACATALAILALCAPAAAQDLGAQWSPPPHADPRDASVPLDVTRVSFGQRDLRLLLRVRTSGPWRIADLKGVRSLCVLLGGGGRLCVGRDAGRAVLRLDDRLVPAAVSRPDSRTLRASLAPRVLGLRRGPFAWAVQARWGAEEDRAPDEGTFAGRISVLAQPRCFGAAARDLLHPCVNRTLRTTAFPAPADALVWPNSPCRPLPTHSAVFDPCAFGVGRGHRATIALIGDSHAVHWRAALEVVAQARRWRGVAITRPGCPFSTQIPASPSLGPAECAQLHRETLAWLRSHPQVRTIFVSSWAQPVTGPQGGTAGYGGGPAAFTAMFDQVPRTVRRIYVLRDIPATRASSVACVESRLRRGASLRGACGAPVSDVLTADPAAAAAVARRPRVRAMSLTRHFCDTTTCWPVVGGTFVHKDDNHMNAVFSTSLGPFVLRALRP